MTRERPHVWVGTQPSAVGARELSDVRHRAVSDPADLPDEPFSLHGQGWLLTVTVTENTRSGPLVHAAARGVDLQLECDASASACAPLLDELRRLSIVHTEPDAVVLRARLSRDQLALLQLLAEGQSVGEAGRTLGMSRRTAYRRVDETMEILGAVSPVDAVRRARVAGLVGLGTKP